MVKIERISSFGNATKILLLLSAALVGYCFHEVLRGRNSVFIAFAAVVPQILAFLLSWWGKKHLSSGIAIGVAVYFSCIFLVLLFVLVGPLGWYFMGFFSKNATDALMVYFLLTLLALLLHVLLLFCALLAGLGGKPMASVGMALLTGAVNLGLGVVAWNSFLAPTELESKAQVVARHQENARLAEGAVVALYSCLFRYASEHAGAGFPRSIASLQAEGCVDEQLVRGEKFEYHFVYAPASPDSSGRISVFHFEAYPVGVGVFTYFGDQSGLLLVRKPGYTPEIQVVDQMPGGLKKLSDCLTRYSEDDPAGSYPQDLTALQKSTKDPYCGELGFGPAQGNTLYDAHGFTTGTYRYVYSPEFDKRSGKVTGYSVVAVPDQYAMPIGSRPEQQRMQLNDHDDRYWAPTIRSYYTDQSGIFRGTPENRLPTASDPEVVACEARSGLSTPECDPKMWRGAISSIISASQ